MSNIVFRAMRCSMKTNDCASCHDGFCTALRNTDFGSKNCPFYRSRKEQTEANNKIMEQLKERKRFDLIKKYHTSNM